MKVLVGLVVSSFLCVLPLQARDPAPKAKKETPLYTVEGWIYLTKPQVLGLHCVDSKGHQVTVGMSLDYLLSIMKQIQEQAGQESL